MNPKISIIVPVYNTSLYLRRCLNSLKSQTSLLVVGPRNIASVEEAKMILGAFVITDVADILNFLCVFYSPKDYLLNMAHQTIEYAK